MSKPLVLNVVQDIATPHNNVLIKALKDATGARPRRGRKPKAGRPAAAAKGGRRRKRAKITPEVKNQVKAAVEMAFNVHVEAVNTMHVRGKVKRMGRRAGGQQPDWKKAVVTLRPGEQITLFEGI